MVEVIRVVVELTGPALSSMRHKVSNYLFDTYLNRERKHCTILLNFAVSEADIKLRILHDVLPRDNLTVSQ